MAVTLIGFLIITFAIYETYPRTAFELLLWNRLWSTVSPFVLGVCTLWGAMKLGKYARTRFLRKN